MEHNTILQIFGPKKVTVSNPFHTVFTDGCWKRVSLPIGILEKEKSSENKTGAVLLLALCIKVASV